MHIIENSANGRPTGIMHPRGVAIDTQSMVVSHLGDRHPGLVSSSSSIDKVSCDRH